MSNEAQGLVRRLRMSAPAKPILLAYANYADELGYCWPGVDVIAWDTGYDDRTVERVRRSLIKDGWMATKRRFGKTAITRLNLAKIAESGEDRRPRTDVIPEVEFEPETAGHPQSRHTVGNDDSNTSAKATHSRELSRHTVGNLPDTQSAISISDSSVIPHSTRTGADEQPVNEREREGDLSPKTTAEPSQDALALIANLEFGQHRRPNLRQARELARQVDAAVAGGLTLGEVKRHAQATVNAARPPKERGNAVSYLSGGLTSEELPQPKMNLPAAATPRGDDLAADDDRPAALAGPTLSKEEALALARANSKSVPPKAPRWQSRLPYMPDNFSAN